MQRRELGELYASGAARGSLPATAPRADLDCPLSSGAQPVYRRPVLGALDDSSFRGARGFARWAIGAGWLPVQPLPDGIRADPLGPVEIVLFRESVWQVVLVTMPPDFVVPPHSHRRCSSADVLIAGSGTVSIGNAVRGRAVLPARRADMLAQLQRVPAGVPHEGVVGPAGAAFLSFQKWSGAPGFVGDDMVWGSDARV